MNKLRYALSRLAAFPSRCLRKKDSEPPQSNIYLPAPAADGDREKASLVNRIINAVLPPLRTAYRIINKCPPYIFLGLALFSLAYWAACVIAAGPGISALFIWPAAAVFFAVCFLWTKGLFPFVSLRKKKWLCCVIAITLCLLFCFFGVVECFVIAGMGSSGEDELDYIIVLGAHVRGTYPSSALTWRIERAYEYLIENPETSAVLSGGRGAGEDISEAECMRRELERLGVAPERLLLEDKSTSTFENISFSLAVINDENSKIGIVTNNFHVWRAVRIARRAGVEGISGIAAPYRNLLIIHYMVREFFSVLANSISGNM